MKSFRKILIANRGEIALRIIKVAKGLGIETVTVFTAQDARLDFVGSSDYSILLEGETINKTYLNIEQLIKIARKVNADAIHPGYGFLSENAEFARKCLENKLVFIGPDVESIENMGDKIKARRIAEALGIPVLPARTGSLDEILKEKENLPYPVLVKASAGGGGKGMKVVNHPDELEESLWRARDQAFDYFGNNAIFVEKFLERPRHVEVQVFGDSYGNYVHLFERECSIQRRHQKIIEESPAPNISEELREKLTSTALKIAKEIKYKNAGTVEFLIQGNEFYFLEMNTRIQVEHPVTEEATGIDLVKEQIKVAEGNPLFFKQDEIKLKSCAIECRVYAEDAYNNFQPSPGEVLFHSLPDENDCRVDTLSRKNNFSVSSDFDPMLTKIITSGDSREEAINNMHHILKNYSIHGIKNNVLYLTGILNEKDFQDGLMSTKYIEHHHDDIINSINSGIDRTPFILPLLASYLYRPIKNKNYQSIWNLLGRWRTIDSVSGKVNGKFQQCTILSKQEGKIKIIVDDNTLDISYVEHTEHKISLKLNNIQYDCIISRGKQNNHFEVTVYGLDFYVERDDVLAERSFEEYQSESREISSVNYNGFVKSPLNGKAVKVNFKNGDKVSKGDILLIIESMKMENRIIADHEGIISELFVLEGEQVKGDQVLLRLN